MRHKGILVAILVILVAALSVGTALATPGSGFIKLEEARATFGPFHFKQKGFEVKSKNTTDVVTAKNQIAVGGHTGWHAHPGPAFAIVQQGLVEVTRVTKKGCETLGPFGPGSIHGQGFTETGNEVHIAKNAYTDPNDPNAKPAVVYVTFLNVPVAGAARIDVSPAPDCASIGDDDD